MLPCLSVVSDLAPVAGQPWPGHDHTRGVRGDTVSCVSPPCYKQLIFRCPPAPHFTVTLCQKIFGGLLLLLCLHGLSRPDTDKRHGRVLMTLCLLPCSASRRRGWPREGRPCRCSRGRPLSPSCPGTRSWSLHSSGTRCFVSRYFVSLVSGCYFCFCFRGSCFEALRV